MVDFATDPSELEIDFWNTELGTKALVVISALDRGELPKQAIDALKELMDLHHSGTIITELGEFNASNQAIRLSNMLEKSINHYMPAGMIDDSRASPSDIKNLLTTASSIIKLINQVQNELYTADRMAAMERAIFKTFEDLSTDIPELSDALRDEIKKSFRTKLEMAFSSL